MNPIWSARHGPFLRQDKEIDGDDEPAYYVDGAVTGTVRRCLQAAAQTNIQVAHALWATTARDLRHAEDHMLLLGRRMAVERVAPFLLEMDRCLTLAGILVLPMCRCDIGDYLGLTLETVLRDLWQFQSEGLSGF